MDSFFERRDSTPDEDFYSLLGCDESSSEEQISTEFKQLALKFHPDKASTEEERVKAEQIFMKLERARTVLLDKEQRAKYDHWRSGGFCNVVSFEKWLEMQNRVHTSMHWAMPQKPVLSLTEGNSKDSSHCGRTKGEGSGEPSTSQPIPTSLEDFRKGFSGASQRSKFRNYDL